MHGCLFVVVHVGIVYLSMYKFLMALAFSVFIGP